MNIKDFNKTIEMAVSDYYKETGVFNGEITLKFLMDNSASIVVSVENVKSRKLREVK